MKGWIRSWLPRAVALAALAVLLASCAGKNQVPARAGTPRLSEDIDRIKKRSPTAYVYRVTPDGELRFMFESDGFPIPSQSGGTTYLVDGIVDWMRIKTKNGLVVVRRTGDWIVAEAQLPTDSRLPGPTPQHRR